MVVSLPWGKSNPFDSDTFMAQVKRSYAAASLAVRIFLWLSAVARLVPFIVFRFTTWNRRVLLLAHQTIRLLAKLKWFWTLLLESHLLSRGSNKQSSRLLTTLWTIQWKEEEVDFNPGGETDIVGSFLGVEVTTGDLIEDVQVLAHHCRLTVVPRHQRPLSRTQQLGKSQLDHLRQHHQGHQGRGVHVGVKTRSTRITDVSFTKDSNS